MVERNRVANFERLKKRWVHENFNRNFLDLTPDYEKQKFDTS